ncbi:MAG: YqgE/AlgH family protein [Rhizobiaceae bacterium]
MAAGKASSDKQLSLSGQLLLAMPGMEDPRFARTVIFVVSHSESGAMGFVLNHPVTSPTFGEVLEEIGLKDEAATLAKLDEQPRIFRGGPVEQGRGFVIHSLDYGLATSTRIGDLGAITATQEILRAMATGHGPAHAIMLLGYSGWGGGQLEEELLRNGWLTMPATRALLFDTPQEELYTAALHSMGVSEELLSGDAGHA